MSLRQPVYYYELPIEVNRFENVKYLCPPSCSITNPSFHLSMMYTLILCLLALAGRSASKAVFAHYMVCKQRIV